MNASSSSKTDSNQDSRLATLEAEMRFMRELFQKMENMVTEKLPKMVKDGFRDLKDEIRDEHLKDVEQLQIQVDKNRSKLKTLEPAILLVKYPKVSIIVALAMYVVAVSDFRNAILGWLGLM